MILSDRGSETNENPEFEQSVSGLKFDQPAMQLPERGIFGLCFRDGLQDQERRLQLPVGMRLVATALELAEAVDIRLEDLVNVEGQVFDVMRAWTRSNRY